MLNANAASMNLIQIFLPLNDSRKRRFEREKYELVEQVLVSQFGGFTAYPRQPAIGLWQNDRAAPEEDDLVVYEVMLDSIDRNWWSDWRRKLEQQFRQDKVLIRAERIEIL
jgi:hypothetical protein